MLSGQTYCNICNFESYIVAIMGHPVQRAAHIKDAVDFLDAVDHDELPSVSFVKPGSFVDGRPASSTLDFFEAMVENILDHLRAKPELFAETRSSSPWMRAAAITIRASSSRSTSSVTGDNPYVPANMPAISDLFDIFQMDGDDLRGDRGDDDGKRQRL